MNEATTANARVEESKPRLKALRPRQFQDPLLDAPVKISPAPILV